jgi:WD40 repeat protein
MRDRGTHAVALPMPPYVETIPGALTFLMGEFKKFMVERITLEAQAVLAQERLDLLADQNAELLRRDGERTRDLEMLEYALGLERQRPADRGTSGTPAAMCDAAVQVNIPHLVGPTPTPPNTGPGRRKDLSLNPLQRTGASPASSPQRDPMTSMAVSRPSPSSASAKRRRPPLLSEEPLPADPPEPQSQPPAPVPLSTSRPVAHGKARVKAASRPAPVRHPSPPSEHPSAKAPVRHPVEQAAGDESRWSGNGGSTSSPPLSVRRDPRFLSPLSPDPEWDLLGTSPNAPSSSPLYTDPADGDPVPTIAAAPSNPPAVVEGDPTDSLDPIDEDPGPIRLDYGDEPKLRSVGSVVHLSQRGRSPGLEFASSEPPPPPFLQEGGAVSTTSGDPPQPAFIGLHSHFDAVRCLAWHPTNAYLVTGSDDHTLKLWNVSSWLRGSPLTPRGDLTPIVIYRGHTGVVTSCCVVNDTVVSGSCDGTVRVWSTSMREPSRQLAELRGHNDAVWSVASHPSRPLLASVGADGRVCVWDWAAQISLKASLFLPENDTPTCVRWDRTANTLVVGAVSGALVAMDAETGQAVLRLDGRRLPEGFDPPVFPVSPRVNSLALSPTAPWCLTAQDDGVGRLWDLTSGRLVGGLEAYDGALTDVTVDPSGARAATAGNGEESTTIWDVGKRSAIEGFSMHHGKRDETGLCVAWHPSRNLLASGGADSTAYVLSPPA